jgi:hypothetical protein
MKSSRLQLLRILFLIILLLAGPARVFPAEAVEDTATVSIPDEVLLQAVKGGLPISIETGSQYVQGDVVIESLEKLEVREKSIFLQGVVSSRNVTLNTTIAGKDIAMSLGSVRLPVSAELLLRFDPREKVLLVTPRFPGPESLSATDPVDAFLLLLSSLGEKEYRVELGSIQPVLARVGTRNIPIALEPVDIQAQKGLLLIKMRAAVTKGS